MDSRVHFSKPFRCRWSGRWWNRASGTDTAGQRQRRSTCSSRWHTAGCAEQSGFHFPPAPSFADSSHHYQRKDDLVGREKPRINAIRMTPSMPNQRAKRVQELGAQGKQTLPIDLPVCHQPNPQNLQELPLRLPVQGQRGCGRRWSGR